MKHRPWRIRRIRWFECSTPEPAEFVPVGRFSGLDRDAMALLWLDTPKTWARVEIRECTGAMAANVIGDIECHPTALEGLRQPNWLARELDFDFRPAARRRR